MKPAPFAYMAPSSLAETLEALAAYGDEAKLLAGGQSLMPLLNMRLTTPEVIVDVNRMTELDYIRQEDGVVCIGALTRQYKLEQDALIEVLLPFLQPVVKLIGHPPIRHAGTVGGSLAHADPAAELPAAMCALKAMFKIAGPSGERLVSADAFFTGYLTVDMAPDEMLVEVRIPAPQRAVWGIREYARRAGDFALAGAAVVVDLGPAPASLSAQVVLFGVGDRPLRVPAAESLLGDHGLSPAIADDLAEVAVRDLACEGDIHASSAYRRQLARAMVRRAVLDAAVMFERNFDLESEGKTDATPA
ncbi:MAG: hypothetical protein ETSY1_23720 [Candidatus Entotheonella factor]|uniref:FAD-binding PCMH-type domain-containing protein n=1 Tax=Entotheonella factor TaxID=1429438 RepID=W4LGN3_ENTF1|nr:xanthine dehydrogenase family protein subunit M [Candidatus Entotheonella palauensis]ETW97162.1 MAG: hypothetical protein ETSY1_23720 [Candidatus Entotheonella factor]